MDVAPILVFRQRYFSSLLVSLLSLSLLLPLMANILALLPIGYINLEYLLIGLCSVFLRRSVFFALLVLESLADFTFRICFTYMLSVKDLFHSLRSVSSLPTHRILEISAVSCLIILACSTVAHVRPRSEDRLRVAGSLLCLLLVLTFVAFLTGHNPFERPDVTYTNGRLVRAPIYSIVRFEFVVDAVESASRHQDGSQMKSASSHAVAFLNAPQLVESPNIVLILVESWGNLLDTHLAQAIDLVYDDPRVARKYDVSHGTVPFQGSTVAAEARELCQSSMAYNILVAPPESLGGCLPRFLHARGYQDLSIHGYSGSMFQREAWYPRIGFDRSWFGPELHRLKLPDCDGVFTGICDAAIAQWISYTLLSKDGGKPRFIYWVTLNSHLPVPAHPDIPDDGTRCTLPLFRSSLALCSWFRLVRNVHRAVQQMALGPSARPTVFVVVGDHAPPFADPKLRQVFSPTDVPFIILTPKIEGSH